MIKESVMLMALANVIFPFTEIIAQVNLENWRLNHLIFKLTFFHDASSKPGGRGLWEAETRRGKMRRSKAISEKF